MAHTRVSSSKSFFGAYAGLSVCTNYPEHISNQKRDIATALRRKLTLISRAQMVCLHSTAMSSIRWVLRPSQLIFGVCASIQGARMNATPVWDEPQQRLNGRDLPGPKNLVSVAFCRGATKRGAPSPTGTPGPDRRHDRVPGGAGRHVGPRNGFN